MTSCDVFYVIEDVCGLIRQFMILQIHLAESFKSVLRFRKLQLQKDKVLLLDGVYG